MYFETDPKAPFAGDDAAAVVLKFLSPDDLKTLDEATQAWAKANGFSGKGGEVCLVPDGNGAAVRVLAGLGKEPHPLGLGGLAKKLPAGTYTLPDDAPDAAHLAFAMGAYRFQRYRKAEDEQPRLAGNVDTRTQRLVEMVYMARDLINIPANDMGPGALEEAFRRLGAEHGAEVCVTTGDALIDSFPMVHAVGRASSDAPRVLDMVWGKADAPRVTLVGKGVTFDTGGLNIKPGSSMALMKKDMGGAANVMALAHAIMSAKLNVRLRVIVGAVENAISGNAFRPGDILQSRKGITVEIGNTDAEGRLVLGDCLALADEEAPHLLIDMATLTGAARVALGPEVMPFYTDDDTFADALSAKATEEADPLWRMPLWPGYRSMLDSQVADVNHISSGAFAGSVTAALFLQKFVEKAGTWAHFDIFGWVPKAKPHAPVGGEAQAIRALYAFLEQRHG
jgi:leucyl aminopeptidase